MRRQASIQCGAGLEPHDHVVWFGDGLDDLYSVATAALRDGACRREKLMFVAEEPDPARLSGIDGLERLLATGQLELVAVDAVYGSGTAFSAATQLATFEGVLADALADGYRGIRVVADNTPLVGGDDQSFRRWLAWEQLTDRFQAASPVTGVCFFDRTALGDERQADLAALHPVRSAGIAEPRFSWFADGDVPLRVRGIGHLRQVVSLAERATPHVRFKYGGSAVAICARCGDVIGVFEPTVIGGDGGYRVTSGAAEPDAVAHAPTCFHRACYLEP